MPGLSPTVLQLGALVKQISDFADCTYPETCTSKVFFKLAYLSFVLCRQAFQDMNNKFITQYVHFDFFKFGTDIVSRSDIQMSRSFDVVFQLYWCNIWCVLGSQPFPCIHCIAILVVIIPAKADQL